jgi:phosphonoacetaldehyde hydrolase
LLYPYFFSEFLRVQATIINHHTDLIPGLVEAVAGLRSKGIKVGSTSGYSRFMIPGVVKAAAAQGYSPDVIVTADEVGLRV